VEAQHFVLVVDWSPTLKGDAELYSYVDASFSPKSRTCLSQKIKSKRFEVTIHLTCLEMKYINGEGSYVIHGLTVLFWFMWWTKTHSNDMDNPNFFKKN